MGHKEEKQLECSLSTGILGEIIFAVGIFKDHA